MFDRLSMAELLKAVGDNAGMGEDYEKSVKPGGRHNGLFRRWHDKPDTEIIKSIRSLREQIALHEEKIRNPDRHISADVSSQQRDGLVTRYWPKEVLNFRQQVNVLEGILRERESGER